MVAIFLGIITIGLAPLLWTWFPDKFKFTIRYKSCTFVDAHMARIDSLHDEEHLCPVQRIPRLAEADNQRTRARNTARLSIYLGHGTTSYVLPDNSAVLVEFLHLRYVYNALDGVFERLSFEVKALTPHDISGELDPPPSPEIAADRRALYGPAEVEMPLPSVGRLLLSEIIHPFMVFQVLAIFFWYYDSYQVYATVILITCTWCIVQETYEVRKTAREMASLASVGARSVNCLRHNPPSKESKPVTGVRRITNSIRDVMSPRAASRLDASNSNNDGQTSHKRDSLLQRGDSKSEAGGCPLGLRSVARGDWTDTSWRRVASNELVCGDIIELVDGMEMPGVDVLLLCGGVVVDEAVLTGEAVPVTKNALVLTRGQAFKPGNLDAYTVHAGTTILQRSSQSSGGKVIAIVVRTGFDTTIGAMLRMLMFPRKCRFNFERDSWRIVMGLGLAACFGGIYVAWLCFEYDYRNGFYQEVDQETGDIENKWHLETVFRVMDLVTIVVPPALPIAMNIGRRTSNQRLRKRQVRCMRPSAINIAGQVQKFVFDKTGTLTQEDVEVVGFVPCNRTAAVSSGHLYAASSSNSLAVDTTSANTNAFSMPKQQQHGHDQADLKLDEGGSDTFDITADATAVTDDAMPQRSCSSVEAGPIMLQGICETIEGLDDAFVHGLACCHTITEIDGNLFGDPLDLKMFAQTGWELENLSGEDDRDGCEEQNFGPSIVLRPGSGSGGDDVLGVLESLLEASNSKSSTSLAPSCSEAPSSSNMDIQLPVEFAVLRRFEFSSLLQRQSVVVHRPGSDSSYIYCKGACERIVDLCDPSTIPIGLKDTVAELSATGKRVLAMAYRKERGIHFLEAQRMCRTTAERDLTFLGLLLLQNKLKPSSAKVIDQLINESSIKCVMATGDNALTAISVARDCGICPAQKPVIFGDIPQRRDRPLEKASDTGVVWTEVPLGGAAVSADRIESSNLQDVLNASDQDAATVPIVLTGAAFRTLRLQHESSRHTSETGSTRDSSGGEDGDGEVGERVSLLQNHHDHDHRLSASSSNGVSGNHHNNVNRDSNQTSTSSHMPPIDADLHPDPKRCSVRRRKSQHYGDKNSRVDHQEFGGRPPDGTRPPNSLRKAAAKSMERGGGKLDANAFTLRLNDRTMSTFEYVVRRGCVFARMSPDDKASLVEAIQLLPEKPFVGMCGDGANDCHALRVADVGVSLSDREASVVAPFTAIGPDKSICAVDSVLREGRASLVNSYGAFKFIAVNALIQFSAVMFAFSGRSNLSDWQSVFVDVFTVLPMCWLMARTEAADVLSDLLPGHSLVSIPMLVSMLGNVLICVVFQAVIYICVMTSSWQMPPDASDIAGEPTDHRFLICPLNTALFNLCVFQNLIVVLSFSQCRPWRKSIWSNGCFMVYSALLCLFGTLTLFFKLIDF